MIFGPETKTYRIALLTRYLRERELTNYLGDLAPDTVAFAITTESKAKNDALKVFLSDLLPHLTRLQTDYVLVTEASMFKVLTKQMQVSKVGGYIFPCALAGFEHLNIIYLPSSAQLVYDPNLITKINQGLDAVRTHMANNYQQPGSEIIKFAEYPRHFHKISEWLEKLLDVELTIDIEAFSLKHYDAGIGTMSLCWNEHEGIAFPIDYVPYIEPVDGHYGVQRHNEELRVLLRSWFRRRKAKTIYHGASYDVYVLIYQLFMKDVLDTEGLLDGLKIMTYNVECTLLITYLATNTCAGNHLGLKDQAQEFAGNYGLDSIKDIRLIPLLDLLQYNLVDGLSTWYTAKKNWPKMVADEQRDIYENLYKPALLDIIQMQLTGLPLDMEAVKSGKAIMEADQQQAMDAILQMPCIQKTTRRLNETWAEKQNLKLKKKRVTTADGKIIFNLDSPLQLQRLLFEVLEFPVLARTATKQPETSKDVMKELLLHTKTDEQKLLLQKLIEYKDVHIILTTFIPAFEKAYLAPDGNYYLFGFYNIGGTLSGRLSSNGPNMQNLPATGTKYAKLIKMMFRAPHGWVFCGLDFASLEDRISGLTTKDPNKLKVYQGHIVYELTINGTCHHIRDDATVIYDGVSYTGEGFYERYGSVG